MAVHLGAGGTLALLVAALLLVVLVAIHLSLLSPLAGFGLVMVTWAGGGMLALAAALWRLRGPEPAWLGLLLAVALLVPALVPLRGAMRYPRIHDATTDTGDPPAFAAAATLAANAGRDLRYPEGNPDSAALQREAFPDLEGARLPLPSSQALAAAERTAVELGWEITWRDEAAGVFEATDTSRLFRFVDDIVVRVRPEEGGARVDVRSTSRVGRSDLGANALRIRAFLAALRRQAAAR